jgi:serine/threonine protein kinase
LKNKPDFRRKPWPSISSGAKDFIKKLLVKNPRARLTAAQALCISLSLSLYKHIPFLSTGNSALEEKNDK